MREEKCCGIRSFRTNRSTHLQWIDCAKGFAILAVLMIHSYNILYTSIEIVWAVDWALSLFVVITGIGSYMSHSRTDLTWGKAYWKSIKKILEAYLICSAVCQVIKTQRFDIREYVYQIIHFNASGPLYYVALHLQLMLISWPLYYLLKKIPKNKRGYWLEFVLFLVVSFVASVTTNYTQILDIYGGGGKVLGGTYLILLYLGMLMMKHECFDNDHMINSIFIWIISGGIWILLWNNLVGIKTIIDSKLPFGEGYDTPSMVSMIYGICTLFAIYSVCKILEKRKITLTIVHVVSWIGRHSLYIFMYHAVILYFFIMPHIAIENIWSKRIVYFGLMIIIPIAIEYTIKLCGSFWENTVKGWKRLKG